MVYDHDSCTCLGSTAAQNPHPLPSTWVFIVSFLIRFPPALLKALLRHKLSSRLVRPLFLVDPFFAPKKFSLPTFILLCVLADQKILLYSHFLSTRTKSMVIKRIKYALDINLTKHAHPFKSFSFHPLCLLTIPDVFLLLNRSWISSSGAEPPADVKDHVCYNILDGWSLRGR